MSIDNYNSEKNPTPTDVTDVSSIDVQSQSELSSQNPVQDDRGCGACEGGCRHNCESFGKKPSRLRYVCGCFLISLFMVLAFFFLLGNSVLNVAVDGVSAVSKVGVGIVGSGKKVMDKVLAEAMKEPEKVVYVDMKFVGAKGEEKLIAAEIRREIHKRVEFNKKYLNYKVFSANTEIKAEAIFEYYVNLGDLRMGIKSAKDGKISAIIYFGELKLSPPVKFAVKEYSFNKSLSPKVNEQAKKFITTDFPASLIEEGRSADNMFIAAELARSSLRAVAIKSILPLAGLDGKNIDVLVEFNSANKDVPTPYIQEIDVR